MKKIIILFISLIILYPTILIVFSINKSNTEEKINHLDTGIKEEIEIVTSKNNNSIKTFNIHYTIPNNFSDYNITFKPDINSLIANRPILDIDQTTINLYIENKCNHDYTYMNKSFKLSTNNQLDINNIKIYRAYNTALQSLLNNNDIDNITDNIINQQLINLGYEGLSDLFTYYLDYYKVTADNISDEVIREIFNGEITNILESNDDILTLGYNWIYDKIITVIFFKQPYYNNNPTLYSIGNYMRNDELANPYIMESFMDILKNKKYELPGISININKQYYYKSFKDFKVQLFMTWSIERTDF